MSQLSKQEMKFIADGIVRKRYGLIQLGGMICIAIFVLVAWEFATANFIWFIVGLLVVWVAIFEPLRYIDTKKELRKLYEIHGDIESGELRESAWSANGIQEEILALYTNQYLDFKPIKLHRLY